MVVRPEPGRCRCRARIPRLRRLGHRDDDPRQARRDVRSTRPTRQLDDSLHRRSQLRFSLVRDRHSQGLIRARPSSAPRAARSAARRHAPSRRCSTRSRRSIDRGQALEGERRTLIAAADERKARRNANAQEVAKRKRAGENADELIAQGRALGDEIAQLEHELARRRRTSCARVLLEIPNVTLPEVPAGGEENNVIVREWGTPRPPDGVKPHWEIGARSA